ncbi:MAG TPA: hypothetical protein VFA09_16715 [Ktedonobacteraceae bacterium]|nr:hypothetical protein [Ktedonobacteraceae bacterium]
MWPFDANNQQMYQQYANAWEQGTYNQLPNQEVQQNYQRFVQNAPPQLVQQVHEQYFQQAPAEQRGGLLQGVLSGLMQRGVNPQQAGIQNTNPYNMSPQEAGRLMGYAQPYMPGMLQQVMANPAAQSAVAGLVSYAAKQMLGNRGNTTGGGWNL